MTRIYGKTFDGSFKKQLDREVARYERKQLLNTKMSREKGRKGIYQSGLMHTTTCSQCERKMSKHTADQQIENKRENAPICIPCILGVARKPLSQVKDHHPECHLTADGKRREPSARSNMKKQLKKEISNSDI